MSRRCWTVTRPYRTVREGGESRRVYGALTIGNRGEMLQGHHIREGKSYYSMEDEDDRIVAVLPKNENEILPSEELITPAMLDRLQRRDPFTDRCVTFYPVPRDT